jgi:hypothetical protein
MAAETRTLPVEPGSQLDAALGETPDAPLLLERAGRLYRLEPIDEQSQTRDSLEGEAAQAAIRRAAGILRGLDVDAFLRELRLQRGQDSSGRPA